MIKSEKKKPKKKAKKGYTIRLRYVIVMMFSSSSMSAGLKFKL